MLNVRGHPESFLCHHVLRARARRRPSGLEFYKVSSCAECRARFQGEAAEEAEFRRLRLPSADLYAGGGGSVLGASRHFSVKHAVDNGAVPCETLKRNNPALKVHYKTVGEFLASGAPPAGSLAMLFAGPPW